MAKRNAFDDLLESVVSDDGDRKALSELATMYPEIRNGYLRQSDYSRAQDELRREREAAQSKLDFAERMERWYGDNWVQDAYGPGRGATKRELELKAQFEQTQERLRDIEANGGTGETVTFDELKTHMDTVLAERGLLGKAEFEQAAAGFQDDVNKTMLGYAHIATRLPTLAVKHLREFDEDLDGDGLVDYAAKGGHRDLTKAYDDYVAERRQTRTAEKHEKALADARIEGRKEALREQGMNPSAMPDDNSSPQMGPLQKKLLGLNKSGADDLPDVEMGRGALAAAASRNWDSSGA